MRRICISLFDDPNDFLQLLHQVRLVVETTRRVSEQNIDIACLSRIQRIKQHRCAVGTCVLRDHRDVVSLASGLKLLDRGSSKRIPGRQHDRLAF